MHSFTSSLPRFRQLRSFLLAGALLLLLAGALSGTARAYGWGPSVGPRECATTNLECWNSYAAAKQEGCGCSFRMHVTKEMLAARQTFYVEAYADRPGRFYLFNEATKKEQMTIGGATEVNEALPALPEGWYHVRFDNSMNAAKTNLTWWKPQPVAMP